jgi:hypothetical protein
MTTYNFNPAGLSDGETLIWNAGAGGFVVGPAAAAPKVIYLANGDMLADLGNGQVDGQIGIVRIGDEPDDAELRLRWRQATARWVGPEMEVASLNDAWAIDGINQQPGDVQNQWYRPIHGVAWYHGSRAVLANDYVPGAGTIVVKNKIGPFAAAGLLMLRGWTPAYTGLTNNGNGTWTFTGVTGGPSVTLYADMTPVIPYDSNNAGDSGGWGGPVRVIDHAAQLWTAGFRLQERVPLVYMNGSHDSMAMDAALWWFQHDPTTDLYTMPAPWDQPMGLPGVLGKGITVTGPSEHHAGFDGTGTRVDERGFTTITAYQDWVSWAAGAPTKRYLKPFLYHRMPAGAKDTGEMYNLHWSLRWIGTP